MIELNKKTKQDFLNREWVQKLLDAGVDMSDAKYYLYSKNSYTKETGFKEEGIFVDVKIDNAENFVGSMYNWILPTYTVSELLYKLHEWARKHAEIKQKGAILIYTGSNVKWIADEVLDTFSKCAGYQDDYCIKYLAALLIQCHKKDIGIATKDTGNISDK